MKKLTKFSAPLLILWSALGAAAPAIPPAMLQQLQGMSAAEKAALAQQYGVTLPQQAASAPTEGLAKPAAALPQAVRPAADRPVARKKSDKPERYGQSLFDQQVSTFAPTDNALVPNDYRIGVGDELVVQLFGKENSVTNLQVGRDGSINFPKLGPISVAGLSFEEAQRLVLTRVTQQFIGVEGVVSMGRLRAMNIFMAGEVNVPGAYSVSALTTMTQALFQAGGVTDIGSLRNIQLKRNGRLVTTFDVYDLLLRGDISKDTRLQSGDVVFVPPFERVVSVEGEVKRPMLYEVMASDRLSQLIAMAGGYKSTAFTNEIVVVKRRKGGQAPQVLNVRSDDASSLAMTMANGDVVRIQPLGAHVENTVTLEGAVSRPGIVGWEPGLRVSDLLGDVRRDLAAYADLRYSLIVRETGDDLNIEVVQFRLVDALTDKGGEGDVLLQPRDRILVFAFEAVTNTDVAQEKAAAEAAALEVDEQLQNPLPTRQRLLKPVIEKLRAQAVSGRPALIASIGGAVKAPAAYPIAADYSLADLIAAAGGADESAYARSFEVRRVQESADGAVVANVINVQLGDAAIFKLQPMDFVTVKRKANWGTQDSVTLSGEVAYPGTYVLMPGETLKDLLARAGGFTREAFIEGAVFTRVAVKDLEKQQARKFAQDIRRSLAASLITQEESKTTSFTAINEVVETLSSYEGKGRLVVDLQRALSGDVVANLEMQEGDALHIPKRPYSIAVVGEVRQPGAHLFDGELKLADYLSLSAGTTARSDEDNVYVVRASGAVERPETSLTRFTLADVRLQPGDTIVVPVDTGYQERLPFWRDVTQVLYQGIVGVVALSGL